MKHHSFQSEKVQPEGFLDSQNVENKPFYTKRPVVVFQIHRLTPILRLQTETESHNSVPAPIVVLPGRSHSAASDQIRTVLQPAFPNVSLCT